jgi:hypothetical protein
MSCELTLYLYELENFIVLLGPTDSGKSGIVNKILREKR